MFQALPATDTDIGRVLIHGFVLHIDLKYYFSASLRQSSHCSPGTAHAIRSPSNIFIDKAALPVSLLFDGLHKSIQHVRRNFWQN